MSRGYVQRTAGSWHKMTLGSVIGPRQRGATWRSGCWPSGCLETWSRQGPRGGSMVETYRWCPGPVGAGMPAVWPARARGGSQAKGSCGCCRRGPGGRPGGRLEVGLGACRPAQGSAAEWLAPPARPNLVQASQGLAGGSWLRGIRCGADSGWGQGLCTVWSSCCWGARYGSSRWRAQWAVRHSWQALRGQAGKGPTGQGVPGAIFHGPAPQGIGGRQCALLQRSQLAP
mmetsp:Transcript_132122/g.229044  ORF Transcript_132122/g.229044 Transcript_132122/m.229044 type:complete len:229 (-) Transcript_132122:263-949(-)